MAVQNKITSSATWIGLLLLAVMVAPFQANASTEYNTTPSQVQNSAAAINFPVNLKGQIANVQEEDGEPAWVQSGYWVLRVFSPESAHFISKVTMARPDGSTSHMHTIANFAVEEITIEDNVHTLKGTVTVTTNGRSADNVPIVIEVRSNTVIAIWLGPEVVQGHFGEEPIHGTVFRSNAANQESPEDESRVQTLADANLPVTFPLTMGYADGNEVFYISTEASDMDVAEALTEWTGARVAYAPSLANTPGAALANIYAFTNGVEGSGPFGFQPNVADSQPGDKEYSPLWRIITVEWQSGSTARTLKSEDEIFQAQRSGEVVIMPTNVIVNCPFVIWEGGSLQIREDKNLAGNAPYGGGQVLEIDMEEMTVTFVAHRGFAPDGETIYYIATDASVKEVADALGVVHVEKTAATLPTAASSDLWVFTNGIKGTGPMGFQASIAGSDVGDAGYSPMWRIVAATWQNADQADFLTSAQHISSAVSSGALTISPAGVIVNCPIVEVA